jgi:hypothetical protein
MPRKKLPRHFTQTMIHLAASARHAFLCVVGNWVCSIPKKTCSFGLSASSTFLLEQISHQNKSAPAISHQPNEQAQSRVITYLSCDWSYDASSAIRYIMDSYKKISIQNIAACNSNTWLCTTSRHPCRALASSSGLASTHTQTHSPPLSQVSCTSKHILYSNY